MTQEFLRTTVVWIARGRKTEVFRSPAEVPAEARRRLSRAVNAPDAVSIVIADAGGREQIGRVVLGVPAQLPDKVRRNVERWFGRRSRWPGWWVWAELSAIGALGLALWHFLVAR